MMDTIDEILEDVRGQAETALRARFADDGPAPADPLSGLKSLTRLIGNKSSSLGSEFSSLEVCTRYDKGRRLDQLEDFRGFLREVTLLTIEAEVQAVRLESAFTRGDRE